MCRKLDHSQLEMVRREKENQPQVIEAQIWELCPNMEFQLTLHASSVWTYQWGQMSQ